MASVLQIWTVVFTNNYWISTFNRISIGDNWDNSIFHYLPCAIRCHFVATWKYLSTTTSNKQKEVRKSRFRQFVEKENEDRNYMQNEFSTMNLTWVKRISCLLAHLKKIWPKSSFNVDQRLCFWISFHLPCVSTSLEMYFHIKSFAKMIQTIYSAC